MEHKFVRAIFPGSFDPITNGHLDVIKRGMRLFDELIVAVGRSPVKNQLFTPEERVEMIAELITDLPGVIVESFDGLMVDYAAKKANFFKRTVNPDSDGIKIETEPVPVKPGDALENEIRSFIQCAQKRARPAVSGEDGKKALALALRIKEEIQKNLQKIPSIRAFYERPEDLQDHPW